MVPWHSDADDNLAALQAIASESGGRVATPADSATLASAFAAIAHAATRGSADAPSTPRGFPWGLVLLLACVFAAFLSVVLLLAGPLSTDSPARRLEAQLERHYAARHESRATDGDGKVASAAVGSVARLLGSTASGGLPCGWTWPGSHEDPPSGWSLAAPRVSCLPHC